MVKKHIAPGIGGRHQKDEQDLEAARKASLEQLLLESRQVAHAPQWVTGVNK